MCLKIEVRNIEVFKFRSLVCFSITRERKTEIAGEGASERAELTCNLYRQITDLNTQRSITAVISNYCKITTKFLFN